MANDRLPEIEYLPPDMLRPYDGNPRTHPEAEITALKASIEHYGFTNPILIDVDGVIIAGHARHEAATELRLGLVPCLRLSGLTAADASGLRIADNQVAVLGGWSDDRLQREIQKLRETKFDVSALGFDAAALSTRLRRLDGQSPVERLQPEVSEAPGTRSKSVVIPVRPEERQLIKQGAAAAANESYTVWARDVLLAAAKRAIGEQG